MAEDESNKDVQEQKERNIEFEASVDNVIGFIMNDVHEAITANTDIGIEEFVEAAASAFESVASKGQIVPENRSKPQIVLQDVIEKTVAKRLLDAFLSEQCNISDDNISDHAEAEFYVTLIMKSAANKMRNSLGLVQDAKQTCTSREETLRKSIKETPLGQSEDLFDPNNSFIFMATRKTDEPIYKRSSLEQTRMLRRTSRISWANMSAKWQLQSDLLEDFPCSDEESGGEANASEKQPIIAKRGSDWMLDENAIR